MYIYMHTIRNGDREGKGGGGGGGGTIIIAAMRFLYLA